MSTHIEDATETTRRQRIARRADGLEPADPVDVALYLWNAAKKDVADLERRLQSARSLAAYHHDVWVEARRRTGEDA